MKPINNLPRKTFFKEQLGNLKNLTTNIKTDLVSAINWLHSFLLDKLGDADISTIGDGTVTGAISQVNSDLGKKQDLITGGVSAVVKDNFNPNVIPVTNANGKIVSSNTPATYLDSLRGNIQEQLDGKFNKNLFTVSSNVDEIISNVNTNGLSVIRTNNNVANMHTFGSGIAFANSDTYGYLNFAYNMPAIYVGGGNNAGTGLWRDSLALKSDLDISSISSSINSTYFYSESENSESYISIRKSGKIAIANINLVLKTALTAGTEYALASLGSPSLYASRSTANCGTKVVDLKIYNNDLNTIVIVPKENLLVGQCMRGQIMFFVK